MSWSKPIPTRAPTTSPPVPAPAEMTRATPQAFAGPPLARSASRDLNAAKSPVRRRPPTYHVPCTVKAQTHYPSHLRDIPATTGCQEGFDHDTWSVCSVIMTHFEKVRPNPSRPYAPTCYRTLYQNVLFLTHFKMIV
ncbi:unnamed protein product [Chondrus crispus]|uniref:Uncharacterized protein n=1 Tax=Chondrus crispus TaxID=2769 RepID=R7Q581_CHOCR|nr:unnamed protein product [Chondrus crispus]CDF32620.1 unnamed protein product [Chondrus crispus]|eukprot:XP_005712391.1 unnamed protein product [Chondrus crispus]